MGATLSSMEPNPYMSLPTYESILPEWQQIIKQPRGHHIFDKSGNRVTEARIQTVIETYSRVVLIDPVYQDAPECLQKYRVEKWAFRAICRSTACCLRRLSADNSAR
jgi:hypothetical protein